MVERTRRKLGRGQPAARRRGRRAVLAAAVGGALTLLGPLAASAQVAPDATASGPLATTSAEYKLPAAVDADVLAGRTTELWARVYRPATLDAGPYPIVVILHGNHATCGRGSSPRIDDRVDYTSSGSCPAGYVVTPNHAGYAYLAEKLASWGIIAVSINANRGINAASGTSGDSGLNLARGRLVLKHLQKLSEWNKNGGTPSSLGVELKDRIDFGQVGLIGHSRGGEGVRAAYNLYRDSGSAWPARILSPVAIRVISEIAPVDGQTSRVLNADGTTWSVLLPLCDGDVSNLQGIKPFDRMMRTSSEAPPKQKAAIAVWGANHNFYNTEWQVSDSSRCVAQTPLFLSGIGSLPQQSTAAHPVLALMRGNLGGAADAAFNRLFTSRFALPAVLSAVTPIERSFQDSAASSVGIVLDDFDKPTGTSSAGAANEASGVTVAHGTVGNRHDPGQRAAALTWTRAGASTYFQSNFTAAGAGRDVSSYAFVNLRAARQVSTQNPATPTATSFKIQLVDADGKLSDAVALSAHMRLTGPVGGPGGTHVLLQSAQIPLASFGAFALTKVRGVRLVFDNQMVVLEVETFARTTTTWSVKAPKSMGTFTVLVRHSKSGWNYELQERPSGTEELPDGYLVPVAVTRAGDEGTVTLVEQTPSVTTLSIWDGRALGLLEGLVAQATLTTELRKKLEPVVKLRQEIGRIDTEIEGLKRQQVELDQRANETRENLEAIKKDPAAGSLRSKLNARLDAFTKDGDRIGRKVVELNSQRLEKKIALEDLLQGLEFEAPKAASK
mgnify:CR=1 FL=1